MADATAAPRAAVRRRRSGHRAGLPARHRSCRSLPALYARWERLLAHRPRSFLRLGSWIGGDRDGNPERHCRLAASRAEARVAGGAGELPGAAARARRGTVDLDRAGDDDRRGRGAGGEERRHQCRRGATSRIVARSPASTRGWRRPTPDDRPGRAAAAVGGRRAVRDGARAPRGSGGDRALARRSAARGCSATGGALGRLIRAVETCGFHLATLDLRQNADVHARVVADLLRVAGVEPRLSVARRSRRASRCCGASSPANGCWPARLRPTADETTSELAIVHAAAEAHALLRPGGDHQLHRFANARASRICSRSTCCSRKAGCIVRRQAAAASIMVVPLFETIGDLAQALG